MRTLTLWTLSLGLLAGLGAGHASAQVPYQLPAARPAVSPYLNLLRQGQTPALNYYNLVRPEVEFRNSITQLQTQTAANRQAVTSLETANVLPTTGHRTGFMTYGGFFLNNNAQGSKAGGTAPTPLRSGAASPTPARR